MSISKCFSIMNVIRVNILKVLYYDTRAYLESNILCFTSTRASPCLIKDR